MSFAVFPVYMILCFCLIVSGDRLQIHELLLLKGVDGREFGVINTVAPDWKDLAIALGFDQATIKKIEGDSRGSVEEACARMFSNWLHKGGPDLAPRTWDALIKCLRQAALIDVADRLKIFLMDKSGMCDYA